MRTPRRIQEDSHAKTLRRGGDVFLMVDGQTSGAAHPYLDACENQFAGRDTRPRVSVSLAFESRLPSLQSPRPRVTHAFSLLEVLVVIAIMAVLMALVVPSTSSLMKSMNMTRAVSVVTDELNFARQASLSRNRDVEVRFYKMDSAQGGNVKQYRALRVLLADGTDPAKSQPLSKLKYLPDPVIISGNVDFSSLLDVSNPSRSGLTQGTEKLPSVTGNTEYVSFLFRANGGTSLKPVAPPTGNWFLTVHPEVAKIDDNTKLPDNYFTAQIDPVTGRLRTFRP